MGLRLKRVFTLIIFLAYLSLLFYLLYFSAYRNSVQGIVAYNVIPLVSISEYFVHYDGFSLSRFSDNFFGNIAAFLPYGFLIPLLFPTIRFARIIYCSFIFSFLIEIMQLLTRVGAFDVDDMILNTIGGALGYLLIKVLLLLRLHFRK